MCASIVGCIEYTYGLATDGVFNLNGYKVTVQMQVDVHM